MYNQVWVRINLMLSWESVIKRELKKNLIELKSLIQRKDQSWGISNTFGQTDLEFCLHFNSVNTHSSVYTKMKKKTATMRNEMNSLPDKGNN